jgi:hypothetical protein
MQHFEHAEAEILTLSGRLGALLDAQISRLEMLVRVNWPLSAKDEDKLGWAKRSRTALRRLLAGIEIGADSHSLANIMDEATRVLGGSWPTPGPATAAR